MNNKFIWIQYQMGNFKNLKSKLNIFLLFSLFCIVLVSIFFIKDIIRQNSIQHAVVQAQQMTNQLLATRKYLAQVAPKAKILDPHLNPFSLAPAYVGAKISQEMQKQYSFYIKQTSLKYRNPNNQPNQFETSILKRYEDKTLNNEYWELNKKDGKETLLYTRPMYIKEACLKCHGVPYEEIPEDIYNSLIEIYGNKSFNYKIGDLRGMISVAVPIDYISKMDQGLLKKTVIFIMIIFIFFILYIYIEKKLITEPQMKTLSDKEEYESTIVESNNNAIVAIDWTAKITTFNKKAEEIFGYSKEEMVGKRNLTKLIPSKYHEAHNKSSKIYLNTGKSCGVINGTHELEALRKDGSTFPIRISFGAKWRPKNAIVVASIIDISKEKEHEMMIQQQSKMASMGEMIGNIAHQWRQPLSAISTVASTAIAEKQMGLLSDEDLDKKFELIMKKTNYLSETIEDFRNFFKQSKEQQEFSVNQVIKSVENIIISSYKNTHITLVNNYTQKEDIKCKGFPSELSQVVINIFNNAKDVFVEKDPKDKVVVVSIDAFENSITISIQDSAGGIPHEVLPKIFEPYFTTKHQSQGTGIGLYMSSEIIHSHFKGELVAENKSFTIDNKEYYGACFSIKIPTNIE